MDYSKGKLYCQLLKDGENEEIISQKFGISLHDLYRIIEFTDINVARKYLKHFCDGYINYVCLCWPRFDEKVCPVSGYEKDCPLKKTNKSC